jgi:phenylacetate-CoA ligase
MGIDFRARDFFYPLALAKTKAAFDRHETLSASELEALQWRQLSTVAAHAYHQVPYYRTLFDDSGLAPSRLASRADFAALPCLTKSILRRSFTGLTAADAHRRGSRVQRTSGTTGGQVRFLVDKTSNVLEFVYYWRFWGWHGYRLYDRFAEMSAESFLPIEDHRDRLFKLGRFTNRVLVNSLLLSRANAPSYVRAFKQLKPRFLKGLPSNLYVFALLCRDLGESSIRFRAVFSQGENLSPRQRSLIEEVFSSPVYDSYGHLERTVAISQCPDGRYHVHPDYGFTEFLPPRGELTLPLDLSPSQSVFEIVSSSLHNLAMPLLRYRTGDLAVIDADQTSCPCGRAFPLVRAIVGRETDIVVTPDGRAVTALYTALDRVTGLEHAQIVQESPDTLIVRVVRGKTAADHLEKDVVRMIHSFTGPFMRVLVEEASLEELRGGHGGKFRSLVSRVDPASILS